MANGCRDNHSVRIGDYRIMHSISPWRPPLPFRSGAIAALLLSAIGTSACSAARQHPGERSAQSAPNLVDDHDRIRAIIAERERQGEHPLWPGFMPASIPAAIFDGTFTWLAQHPSPPAEFSPVAGAERLWRMNGRHPAVTANNSVAIGGVLTATLLANERGDMRRLAATLVHESFHAFQRQHYPSWQANEVDLLTYPLSDAEALAARRSEFAALRRALDAPDAHAAACWARTARAERERRYARLPASAAEYERRTEMWEGLARYVENSAQGRSTLGDEAVVDLPAESIREHLYRSGFAQALLLDRLQPEWRLALRDSAETSLDGLLAIAGGSGERCRLAVSDQRAIDEHARRDVAALGERLSAAQAEFLSRGGWTLRLEGAPQSWLSAHGFDPLNVRVLNDSTVLHLRYLKVGHASGSLEVMDSPSLTTAAGPHPLFAGLRTLIVTGLDADPLRVHGDSVAIESGAVRGSFRGARVERAGQVVRLSLP